MRYFLKEKGTCMRTALLFTVLIALIELAAGVSKAEESAFRSKFDREVKSGQPVLISTLVDTGPVIDGEVEKEVIWQKCERTHGAWVQIATGQPTARQTVVYSCYDQENLYFGFVCEEPELENLRMDGTVEIGGRAQVSGPDDSVEVVIEAGALNGSGEVYSFRGNQRGHTQSWGLTSIPNEAYVPKWACVGKLGSNRWTVEMKIPFQSLKRNVSDKGVALPSRGDVLGLKLVRYGAATANIKDRMVSTWNTNIAFPLIYVAGMNGLLYFDDANVLRDEKFTLAKGSPWIAKGAIDSLPSGGVRLERNTSIEQKTSVHPKQFYTLALDCAGAVKIELDGKDFDYRKQKGFWTGEKQENVSVAIKASEAATVSRIVLQHAPNEDSSGLFCLTNNYPSRDRNISDADPAVPIGRYRYVQLDNMLRLSCDDNPSIRQPLLTNRNYENRVEDLGGRSGWIPFDKGSLTGRPEPVFWQTENPNDPATWGRHTHVIEIDLGRSYWVDGLDVLWPASNTITFEVWGKEKEEDEWVLLFMDDGQYVAPEKRKPARRAYESVRGLDSDLRFIRWRGRQCNGDWVFPQLDGIQEMWVWGKPIQFHRGIHPFKPWTSEESTLARRTWTPAPDPDMCQILPRPKEIESEEGWFVISPQTRIVAQKTEAARQIAEQIRDEIQERWRLEVPVVEEPSDGQSAATIQNAIYIGQKGSTSAGTQFERETGLQIEDKPQSYILRTTRQRATVIGNDADGMYWGVQSMMFAMRWHSSKEPEQNGLGVRCSRVRDWPATLERGIMYWKGFLLFNYCESEIPRLFRNCHLQSRFKWNAVYASPPASFSWPQGFTADICRRVHQQYHLEIRPELLYHPLGVNKGWEWAARLDSNLVENDPDEDKSELAEGLSLNLCPLDKKTYDLAYAKIDQLLSDFGNPSKIWLGGLALHSPAFGSRWAVCRECQKSGKTREEIFSLFANNIARHLAQRNVKGLLEHYNVAFGDLETPEWKTKPAAADVRTLPSDFEYGLPPKTWAQMGAFLSKNLTVAGTANGPAEWPSTERYYYRQCPAYDMWTEAGTPQNLLPEVDAMWSGRARADESGKPDDTDLWAWLNQWHFRRDLPSWRAGERPACFPIDLRQYVTCSSHPTGKETLEPGRMAAMDLRHLPAGRQVLSGVEFDIIDPDQNGGKSILMVGRPFKRSTHPKDLLKITECAGPIPVGRKLASLAFLRTSWVASIVSSTTLMPCCRVRYEDNSWLIVDCFRTKTNTEAWNIIGMRNPNYLIPWTMHERIGWLGSSPTGSVQLKVVEWVNPYPSKTIKSLEFVCPEYEDDKGEKLCNSQCEAIVAISGIEPIQQDYDFWNERTNRPPLLAPIITAANPGELLIRTGNFGAPQANYATDLMCNGMTVRSTVKLSADASWIELKSDHDELRISMKECGAVVNCSNFKAFTAEQTLEPAVELSRVEVRGPGWDSAPWNAYAYSVGRNHRIDVGLEISEDGTTWRKAGELRGILADADFLPIEFSPALVKKLRFTATAAPYHNDYFPGIGRDYTKALDCPYFVWRLFAIPPKR